MIPEIGQLALILALILSLVQTGAGLIGAWRGDARLMAMGRAASLAQAGFIVVAFCALAASYGLNDYSVALVAEHSNRAQPLIYRLGATWGSHEGSMLLWVLILAIYGGAVAVFGHTLRESLQARVLAIQGLVGAAFLGFMLFTSNPFLRLFPTPPDGAELNPVLQDPGLIFHPPVLYLGYVGFSMAFSFGVAALLEGRVDGAWARWVRPWVLAAWIWLTIGIAAGSIWAYYTLGWGGWWFWDPVENASLMPWLIGTALLHSSLVLERRGALISWTILLAILTFSMSLVGTFLVRSGVLTSVHAFALDAKRGVYILGIIAVLTGSALILFAARAPAFRSGAIFTTVSREFAVMMNNVLLVGAMASVFFGTFYPVFLDVLHGDKISVGPPYFHATFGPIFMVLLTLVSFGPILAWRRDGATSVLRQVRVPGLIAIAVLLVGALLWGPLTGLGLALGVWLIGGAILVLARRKTLRAIPLAVWGMVLAHAGLGVTTLGITGVSSFASDKVLLMAPGETTTLAGRTLVLESLRVVEGANYQANQATFRVSGPLGSRELISERRWFPASQSYTTRAGIGASPLGNTYISLGEAGGPGKVIVRLWIHPLVGWIWAGVLTMAFGGVLSLADRGLRRVTVNRPRAAPATDLGPVPIPA
jgi:cytochrome c-type biogenesis protein CcmF